MNTKHTGKLLGLALVATLLIRIVLASIIPMSGDEAYFLIWGKVPDFGFYDHPPMVGWLLQLMLQLGDSEVVLRLPPILLPVFITLGIYWLLLDYGKPKACLGALLFLLSPVNVLNVIITTDTPLILFSFLSAAALFKALKKQNLPLYMLSGAFLGLAFLSKYFSVLLGLAYFAYFIFSIKERKKTLGFVLLFLTAAPFIAVNLYWNYGHCWANVMFNLYNRNQGEVFALSKPLTYLATQLYLITPVLLFYLARHKAGLREKLMSSDFRIFAFAFAIPMGAFAVLSLKKVIGLHWVLSFYPFLYLLLALLLTQDELVKSVKFMLYFSLAHLLAIAVIAFLPLETWKHSSKYDGIVFMFKTDELVQQLRPYERNFNFATDGYSPSAIISYHFGKNFAVFGEGSSHARHDDIVTDFSKMNGQNILILRKSEPPPEQYEPYFKSVEYRTVVLHQVPFYIVLGYGFDYPHYRDTVLRRIKNDYYAIPGYLPVGACYFCEKYFPGEACRGGPQ